MKDRSQLVFSVDHVGIYQTNYIHPNVTNIHYKYCTTASLRAGCACAVLGMLVLGMGAGRCMRVLGMCAC